MATRAERISALATAIATTIKQRGVPAGGASGQQLRKTAATDYATAWVDSPGATAAAWHSGTVAVGANSGTFINTTILASNDDATRYALNGGNALQVLKAGLYLLSWFMDCDGTGTGSRTAFVQKSGGTTLGEVGGYNGGVELRLSAVRVVRLAANDTVYLNAYFSTAGQVLGAAAKDTGLSLTYLGA